MRTAALILAAGAGRRTGGDRPKQLQDLMGRPLLSWSLEVLNRHPAIAETVLVIPPGAETDYGAFAAGRHVPGGDTRTLSVRAGLAALSDDVTHVLIHDAARPGLTPGLVDRLLSAMDTAAAAAPALPVVDALKRQTPSGLTGVDRSGLYRVQTPQAFRLDALKSALEASGDDLVDDLAAVEATGLEVILVPGEDRNMKVTHASDFDLVARLMAPPATAPRIGSGFDVHAFAPGDGVVLCGVTIPHAQGLAGFSDADVAWHALTDAIFGALALGDLGDHFPPGDPAWKGVSSEVFLRHALALAAERGYRLASCDLTVICEAPKLKPHREAMRLRTAEVTGLPLDAVSLKATTTEGLGFTGRREGIAAQALSVLVPEVRAP